MKRERLCSNSGGRMTVFRKSLRGPISMISLRNGLATSGTWTPTRRPLTFMSAGIPWLGISPVALARTFPPVELCHNLWTGLALGLKASEGQPLQLADVWTVSSSVRHALDVGQRQKIPPAPLMPRLRLRLEQRQPVQRLSSPRRRQHHRAADTFRTLVSSR